MIHPTRSGDGYVISSRGMWLPGVYETERAARYAFRFPDEVLQDLSERICRDGRVITSADLRAAREGAPS
jgi:hypothetical protein